jgi:hypothetical protein
MDPISVALGAGNITVALVFMLLARPLIRGRVPRNGLFGFRLRQAYESESNWLRINRFGGIRLFWWSVPLLLAGTLTLFLTLTGHPAVMLGVGCLPLIVLIPVYATWRYARTL